MDGWVVSSVASRALRERGERDERGEIECDPDKAVGGIDRETYHAWREAIASIEHDGDLLRRLAQCRDVDLLNLTAPLTWPAPYRDWVATKTREKKRAQNSFKQFRRRAGRRVDVIPQLANRRHDLRSRTHDLDRATGTIGKHAGRRPAFHADRAHAAVAGYLEEIQCRGPQADHIIWRLLKLFRLTTARDPRTLARKRKKIAAKHPKWFG